ncbi:hypothetical protein GS506_20225 [Rhodococcus hoagii]|nr:hypothetical protein [Prescottella equi]
MRSIPAAGILVADEEVPEQFLNDFRDLSAFPHDRVEDIFGKAVEVLAQAGARELLRKQGQRVNAALVEASVVGCMRRISGGNMITVAETTRALTSLIEDQDVIRSLSSGTTSEESVNLRLAAATRHLT